MSAANINAAFKSCVALGNKSWLDVNWGVEGCDASNPNWIRVNDDDDGRARLWILAISIKVKIGKEKSEWMMAGCAPCNEQPPTDDHQTAVCSTFIFLASTWFATVNEVVHREPLCLSGVLGSFK